MKASVKACGIFPHLVKVKYYYHLVKVIIITIIINNIQALLCP